jgi:hypothetical protein
MGGMQLRTAALVGVLGLGLGWAVGSRMPAGGPAGTQQGRGTAGPRPLGVGQGVPAQPLTEQLRLKLERQPKAPHPSRNPFVFGARPSAAPAPRAAAAATVPGTGTAAAANDPEPPRPGSEFRLTGMASSQGPDGPEFTAMVHDGRSLLFVKRGDTLPGGFAVVDLQESSVTLRDAGGSERTLRLR